jgi:hypothetical protein
MNDVSPVLLAVCGFLIVALGLIIVGGLLMYRFLRFNVFSMAMGYFMRHQGDELESDPQITPIQRSHNLRAKAEALDFDAALARHSKEAQVSPAPETQPKAGVANPFEGFKPSDSTSNANGAKRRKRRDSNEKEDEIFGGMLDEDGDGDIDF